MDEEADTDVFKSHNFGLDGEVLPHKYDFFFIRKLMERDSIWNLRTGSNIMWWIDICSEVISLNQEYF